MENLKQLRVDAQKTQQEMADFLGVDRSTYVKYERGSSDPPTATLVRLADFFGVSVDRLLGHTLPGMQPAAFSLPSADAELLQKFHALDRQAQARILNSLEFEYQATEKEGASSFSSLA